ncbi:MAG: hypothetical protein ABWY63_00735 [Hyphomicrobiaceae bacterium]
MVAKPDRAASAGYSYGGGSKSKSTRGLGKAADANDGAFSKAVQKATFNPGLRRGVNMPLTKEQQRELRDRSQQAHREQMLEQRRQAIRTPPPGMVPPRRADPNSAAEVDREINRALQGLNRRQQDQQRRQSQPKAPPPASKTPPRLNVEPKPPPPRFSPLGPMPQSPLKGRTPDLKSRSRMSERQRESLSRGGR